MGSNTFTGVCARKPFRPFARFTSASTTMQLPDLRFTPLPPFGQSDSLAALAHSIALHPPSPGNSAFHSPSGPSRPDVTIVFLMQNPMSRPLAEADPEIYEAIRQETERQGSQLELIASENFTS